MSGLRAESPWLSFGVHGDLLEAMIEHPNYSAVPANPYRSTQVLRGDRIIGLVDLDMTVEKDVYVAHVMIQVLRGISNKSFGFTPQLGGEDDTLTSGSAIRRERAVKSWFGWWQINKDIFSVDLVGLEEAEKQKRLEEKRKRDKERRRKSKK